MTTMAPATVPDGYYIRKFVEAVLKAKPQEFKNTKTLRKISKYKGSDIECNDNDEEEFRLNERREFKP